MTQIPRDLSYEVLVGCSWVAIRPEHVRKNDVFRVLRKDGSPFLVAARAFDDVADAGIYVAHDDGTSGGVEFKVVQPITLLVAPVIDPGG